jgi:hypothetical protein
MCSILSRRLGIYFGVYDYYVPIVKLTLSGYWINRWLRSAKYSLLPFVVLLDKATINQMLPSAQTHYKGCYRFILLKNSWLLNSGELRHKRQKVNWSIMLIRF